MQPSLFPLAHYLGWSIAAALLIGQFASFHPLADSFAHFRLHLACLAVPVVGVWLYSGAHFSASVLGVIAIAGFLTLGPANASAAAKPADHQDPNALRIMSLNLHHRHADIDRVVAYVEKTDPDVIAFQETLLTTPSLPEKLGSRYPNRVVCRYRGELGVVVLSRVPVKGTGCVNDHRLAWLRVEHAGRAITVASIHLRWPFPASQAAQIRDLQPYLSELPHPVALLGDFNAVPWSHSVEQVEAISGTKVIPGLRQSYTWDIGRVGKLVGLPIDHALVSPGIDVANIELGPNVSSDHLPVIVDVGLGRDARASAD